MPGASYPSSTALSNPLLAMMLQMFGQQMMPEGMELGQWDPNQNLLDTRQAREFEKARMGAGAAIGTAGAASNLQELISGTKPGGGLVGMNILSEAQGEKFGEMIQSSDFSRTLGTAMPMLGMMAPGAALDEMGLGGMQASSSYAGMARGRMGIPGQPGTGLTGDQLQQQTTQITAGLHQDLFSGSDRTKTRGMQEGQMGQLAGAAQQMGRGPGDMSKMSREDRAGYISDLSKSTSAVRDMGGDYANLSASQTLGALDQITMGGFSAGESNEKLEEQTRMFKQLSRGADISAGEAMGLQQLGGMRSEQLGGDKQSGVTSGQHAMAFGAAAKDSGLAAKAGVSVNEMMQQDAVLTAQAGRSETGNMAAALMRMGETGMLGNENSAAYKAYTALKDKGEFSAIQPGDFRKMLQDSGVDMGAAAQILQQRGENMEMFGDDVAGAVRETQWDADIGSFIQRSVANTIGTANAKRGIKLSTSKIMEIGKAVADTIRAMAGKPRDEVRAAIAKRFEAMGATPEDAMAAAETALGAAGEAARQKGYKGTSHAAAMHSKEMLAAVRDKQAAAKTRAEEEIDLAPDAQVGVVGRIMDAIKEGNPKLAKFLARLVGGVEVDREAATADEVDREAAARDDLAGAAVPDPEATRAAMDSVGEAEDTIDGADISEQDMGAD